MFICLVVYQPSLYVGLRDGQFRRMGLPGDGEAVDQLPVSRVVDVSMVVIVFVVDWL